VNKLEAERLAQRSDDRHKKATHDAPDTRQPEEQIHDLNLIRFERRLARRALAHEHRLGSWPNDQWFSRHRAAFLRHLRLAEYKPKIDPPCKHWRRICPVDFLPMMEIIWKKSLHIYALRYHYLASPTAKCGCRNCSTENHTIDDYDWSSPPTI